MPILDIEIVAPDSTPVLPANLTQSLADEAAQVFGAQAGTVWVKSTNHPARPLCGE